MVRSFVADSSWQCNMMTGCPFSPACSEACSCCLCQMIDRVSCSRCSSILKTFYGFPCSYPCCPASCYQSLPVWMIIGGFYDFQSLFLSLAASVTVCFCLCLNPLLTFSLWNCSMPGFELLLWEATGRPWRVFTFLIRSPRKKSHFY